MRRIVARHLTQPLVWSQIMSMNKPAKNPAAVKLGRMGWAKLSAEERSELARRAIKARWDRYREAQAAQAETEPAKAS
jgi:hypothetical protein